jgi:hypothetical protein
VRTGERKHVGMAVEPHDDQLCLAIDVHTISGRNRILTFPSVLGALRQEPARRWRL